MKIRKKQSIALIAVIGMIAVGIAYGLDHYLTFESLRKNREILLDFVDEHYVISVMIYVVFFMSTAFFIPGAIIATITGGFMYGVLMGTLYVNIGSTAGATLAFLLSRHMIGKWVQRKYRDYLSLFNREIERHGSNYLFTLRIIPLLPFFLTNYLAGLTRISVTRFIATTSLGMLPGSIVYTYAGEQLSKLNSPEDIRSTGFIAALLLLAFFALLPVFIHHTKKLQKRKR
ncbi:MAG: TVP38/TMEM64 family protein [Nitrospirota bacterium]